MHKASSIKKLFSQFALEELNWSEQSPDVLECRLLISTGPRVSERSKSLLPSIISRAMTKSRRVEAVIAADKCPGILTCSFIKDDRKAQLSA